MTSMGEPERVSPKLPSLENHDIAFSHSIDSSHKGATKGNLLSLKELSRHVTELIHLTVLYFRFLLSLQYTTLILI